VKLHLAVYFALLILSFATQADESSLEQTFTDLSNEELRVAEPVLKEQNFSDGYPESYRRQRLVKIDTHRLKKELSQDWSARQEGATTNGVVIPLFQDTQIFVQVDTWITDDAGFTSGYGRALDEKAMWESFDANFSVDGRLWAAIRLLDSTFVISSIGDPEYYVVTEQEPFSGAID
jgi:hypothetical protein